MHKNVDLPPTVSFEKFAVCSINGCFMIEILVGIVDKDNLPLSKWDPYQTLIKLALLGSNFNWWLNEECYFESMLLHL